MKQVKKRGNRTTTKRNHTVFIPKKGKGSYKKPKHKNKY